MSISENSFNRLKLEENLLATQTSRDNLLITQYGYSKPVDTENVLEVFQHFISSVNYGITPTADVLAAVAKGLTAYIINYCPVDDHKYKLKSLDECFGLKPKQRVGHPVEHMINRCKRIGFLESMWQLRRQAKEQGQPISIDEAAGLVINYYNLDIGEDILKKEYISTGGDIAISLWRKQNKTPVTLIKKGKQ